MRRLLAALSVALAFLPVATLAQDALTRTEQGIVERVDRAYEDERGFRQAALTVQGLDGRSYHVDTAESLGTGLHYGLEPGDRVSIAIVTNPDGTETPYYNDVVRSRSLVWIVAVFAAITLAVGLLRGLRALLGLLVTIVILFGFLFPAIFRGADPVLMTLIASLAILGINLHLTHGWKRETATAFLSTAAGLALSWVFGKWFVAWSHLSGVVSEEASVLYLEHLGSGVNMSGILLSGIILGAVGALDDVAISQGEIVAELRDANPKMDRKELFVRAMRVGRHHIASIANTLVLAYAGAALPMFLLFWSMQSVSTGDFLNTEQVAEEAVRTIVGTAALILTVPISTWLAVSLDRRA